MSFFNQFENFRNNINAKHSTNGVFYKGIYQN